MSTKLALIAVVSIGPAALLGSISGSQSGRPPAGARVAVVAYHDSRLFTLCPVFGKQVIESHILTSGMEAKASVSYPPIGGQSIALMLDAEHAGMAPFPLPAGAWGSQWDERAGRRLDRLARDVDVERRLVEEFRARRVYTVVATPEEADIVFIAESSYVPRLVGTGDPVAPSTRQRERNDAARILHDADDEWNLRRRGLMGDVVAPAPVPAPPGTPVIGVLGGDRPVNWRQWILAGAVPATVYRQHRGGGAALVAARVWSDLEMEHWKRDGDRRATVAASPEALVRRFHGKNQGLPAYLPICAATTGRIRAIDEEADVSAAAGPPDTASAVPPADARPGARRPRFASRITLVAVPVTVTGRDGQPLHDLPLDAFRVFEDEVEQQVTKMEAGSMPASIAVLVDTSSSMRGPREAVRQAAPTFAGAFRDADRVMVATLSRDVRLLTDFTTDRGVLQREFTRLGPGGGTRLYDAIALVTVDALDRVDGRKAIVLLTDGVDTQSQLTTADGALAAIESSNIPVFVVRYDTGDAGTFLPPGAFGVRRWVVPPASQEKVDEMHGEADRFLIRLAAGSGGRLYAAHPDADVPDILAHISEELSQQIILGYYPSNDQPDGGYRRIRVTALCDGCTVRARAGYRAGVAALEKDGRWDE